uniref:BZIP domain-containing protein n=1 Tax=Panagrolaimus sp. JU765 TaxID=591449 RepID=A0AC34RAU1_9BILA
MTTHVPEGPNLDESTGLCEIQRPIPVFPGRQMVSSNNLMCPTPETILAAFNEIIKRASQTTNSELDHSKLNSPELFVDVCGEDNSTFNQSPIDLCSQASHSATEASSSPSPRSNSAHSRRSSASQEAKDRRSIPLPPTRVYRRVTDDIRESDEYKTKRLRNNDAVRRSRENSKMKREQERQRYDELLQKYNNLIDYVRKTCGTLPDFELNVYVYKDKICKVFFHRSIIQVQSNNFPIPMIHELAFTKCSWIYISHGNLMFCTV